MMLGFVDYVVAGVILLVPLCIGVSFAWKDANSQTRDGYLLGGRQMSAVPVALSLFVSYISAISLMGSPVEVFFYGSMVLYMVFAYFVTYMFSCYTLVPLIYPLKLTSVYEYFYFRFKSRLVQKICSAVGMFNTMCYMSIALLSPALALETCADIPLWMSIALIGCVGTLYTAVGGFKSVIWTDVFQALMILIGMFVIIIKACVEVGGLSEVWRIADEGERTKLDTFTPDPRVRHTFWGLTFGFFWLWMTNMYNQTTTQRILSTKSLRDAKQVFLLNIPLLAVYKVITLVTGFSIYAYYKTQGCDPLKGGFISNANQLAPFFVLQSMGDIPGMAGLFTGILCCASLSTLSSGINSLAANTLCDFLKGPLRASKESTITLITKAVTVVYGAIIIGLTYLAKSMQGPVTQMVFTAFGAIMSPILGAFLIGATVPWANKYGAFSGALISLIFNLWVSIGSKLQGRPLKQLPPITTENCHNISDVVNLSSANTISLHSDIVSPSNVTYLIVSTTDSTTNLPTTNDTDDTFFLYDISYEWYTFMGTFLCVTVGLIVSHFTNVLAQRNEKDTDQVRRKISTDARYIFPCLRRYWGFIGDGETGRVDVVTSPETTEPLSRREDGLEEQFVSAREQKSKEDKPMSMYPLM